MMEDKKMEALKKVLTQIEKDFGKGAIINMANQQTEKIEVIPTGCLALDKALGIGGYPRGRIIEIYGPESSGKTTLALHAIAEAQKLGGIVAFIDAEHALDPVYAANLGVDLERLYVSQPDNGEQALDIVEELVKSGSIDLVVVDSVAALTPKAEIDGEMGESHMGLQARLMSQALRKLTAIIGKTKTCIIFINQLRDKVGIVFGSPEVTTGGKALKFYCSIRIDVRKGDVIKEGADFVGNRTKIKVVKNKLAAPFKLVEVDLIYGQGLAPLNCLLDMSVELDLIQKSGSWYRYEGEQVGQGKEKALLYLQENPTLVAELEEKVRATF
ncbi:MAG: recombinase RecA [Clostridiales bacterium]|nr:recombinase RecA [Clostridiales bacterium]